MTPKDDDERDAVLNGLAHGLAVYEQLPGNWIRLGETQIVRDLVETLSPPARHKCDTAQPLALRVARKDLAELFKRGPISGQTHGGRR
jgi:hypothetical protein